MTLLVLLAAVPVEAQSKVNRSGTSSVSAKKSPNTGLRTKVVKPKGVDMNSKEWKTWQEQVSIRMSEALSGIKYPKESQQRGEQGTVVVNFKVKADGSVGGVKVVKNATPLLDAEAVRMVESTSGKWSPLTQNGKPIETDMMWPVKFKLSK